MNLILEDGSGFLALEIDDAIACELAFEDSSGGLVLEDNSGFFELEICAEVPPVGPSVGGGAGFVHRFTRRKWRELQMLIAAEQAARAKADRVTKPEKQEALLEAAAAADEAIRLAEIEGENKRLDALLVRNAEALRAAIRATNQVKLLKEAAQAIEISQLIAKRLAEDEEDEMITLLLMS